MATQPKRKGAPRGAPVPLTARRSVVDMDEGSGLDVGSYAHSHLRRDKMSGRDPRDEGFREKGY